MPIGFEPIEKRKKYKRGHAYSVVVTQTNRGLSKLKRTRPGKTVKDGLTLAEARKLARRLMNKKPYPHDVHINLHSPEGAHGPLMYSAFYRDSKGKVQEEIRR